jgi:hypothetical protein
MFIAYLSCPPQGEKRGINGGFLGIDDFRLIIGE